MVGGRWRDGAVEALEEILVSPGAGAGQGRAGEGWGRGRGRREGEGGES